MKKIKVLQVVGKPLSGGVGAFLFNMNQYIDTKQFQVDYLINKGKVNGEFEDRIKRLGSVIYYLPELNYKNTLCYLKELRKFYSQNQDYDIIHIHSPNIVGFNYLFFRKNKMKTIVVHSHSTKYSDSIFNTIRNYFLLIPIKYIANVYFACSVQAGKFLFGNEFNKNQHAYVINNSINTQLFSYNEEKRKEIRDSLNIKDKLVIGHVGSFLPVKNHDFIIDIFYELHKLNKETILVLVGTGELLEKIKDKVVKLGILESVIFLGNRDDVYNLMQSFDAFLMPSIFEGVPLVGIEAQASGLPCFLSDTITKDVKIIDKVFYLELNQTPVFWAKSINNILLKGELKGRNGYNQLITEQGYDIIKTVKDIEEIYKKELLI